MLYQNADSEYTVIVVIALVAIVVFMLMLIATFAIFRSERKTKTAAPSKDELESGSPAVGDTILLPEDRTTTEVRPTSAIKVRSLAAGSAGLFSIDRRKDTSASGQGATIEKLSKDIKTLNWVACFTIASYIAFLGYDRLQYTLFPLLQLPGYYWFAKILPIISPTCIAVAWLRLTGIKWPQALLLFLFVPVGVFVISI